MNKRIINSSSSSSSSRLVQKLDKCQKTSNSHNFVKDMTIKNPNSRVHLQIIAKHSAKFPINSIKDVAGVAGTMFDSARTITPPKMVKTKIKNHMHIFIS